MNEQSNPIKESLPYDSEIPGGVQPAYEAFVRVLVPCVDVNGTPVNTVAAAADYIAETLRSQFLDWGYPAWAPCPSLTTVCDPYVEGTF